MMLSSSFCHYSLLLALMLCVSPRQCHAFDQSLEEEAVKVIRYMEQNELAVYAGRSIFHFWIRTERVEEAFAILERVISLEGLIEDYSQKMLELNKSEILLGQLKTIESNLLALLDAGRIHEAKFAKQNELLKRIKEEVTYVHFLISGQREKGLKQFDEMKARLLFEVEGFEEDFALENPEQWEEEKEDEFGFNKVFYGEMRAKIEGRIRILKFYALQAIQEKEGDEEALQLIEQFCNEVPAKVGEQEKEWFSLRLERYLQPPGEPSTFKDYQERRQREAQAKFDSIDRLSQPVEWAAKVIELQSSIPLKHRLVLLDEVAEVLADCDIENESVEELQWKLVPHHLKRKNWDQLLSVMKNHNPGNGDEHRYQDIFDRVSVQISDRLESFVDALPDSDERFQYSQSLVDDLLHRGYLSKAKENVGSVDFGAGAEKDLYLRKIRFYEALRDARYKDVDAIADAYLENEVEGKSDIEEPDQSEINNFSYYYKAVLGDDHLAMIAERGGPEVAIGVARRVPNVLAKHRRGSDLGRCMSALIRRGRPDLAIKAFNVATEQEQIDVSLVSDSDVLSGERALLSLIPHEDWEIIETVIPNEWRVVNRLMTDALKRSDKARSFELARRNWMRRADIPQSAFLFTEKGWGLELLALANEIQTLNVGDQSYDRLVENTVESIADYIEFTTSVEAIAFAEKYLKSKQRKAEFLMGVVEKWSRK